MALMVDECVCVCVWLHLAPENACASIPFDFAGPDGFVLACVFATICRLGGGFARAVALGVSGATCVRACVCVCVRENTKAAERLNAMHAERHGRCDDAVFPAHQTWQRRCAELRPLQSCRRCRCASARRPDCIMLCLVNGCTRMHCTHYAACAYT